MEWFMSKKGIAAQIILMLLLLPLSWSYGGEGRTYTVAVVPQYPRLALYRDWTPFLKRLSRETGIPLRLKIYNSIPQFSVALMRGEPDFAYMNPYHLVLSRRRQGYIPLVRDGSSKLKGILVVRKDSPIRSIQELDGKQVAFPSPGAFGASLYMRSLLARKKIAIKPIYVLTHTNVYRNVIVGRMIAGGGVYRTFHKEPAGVRMQLRVLFTTPGVASHPIAAHPRVPRQIRARIVDAIFRLARDQRNKDMLKAVQMTYPVRAVYQRDYRPLEKLGLVN